MLAISHDFRSERAREIITGTDKDTTDTNLTKCEFTTWSS